MICTNENPCTTTLADTVCYSNSGLHFVGIFVLGICVGIMLGSALIWLAKMWGR